jgi:hypothetical protein
VSCQACNRAKRNWFPVIGRRLEPGDPISAEQPLLLDPYTDEPSEHIAFDPDSGLVIGITDRGAATIQILALNRDGLVETRLGAARTTRMTLVAASKDISADLVSELTDPRNEYAALRREVVKRHISRISRMLEISEPHHFSEVVREAAGEVAVPDSVKIVPTETRAV